MLDFLPYPQSVQFPNPKNRFSKHTDQLIDILRRIWLDLKFDTLNFRDPEPSRISFFGVPDIKGTYKNCRKIKRKFKM